MEQADRERYLMWMMKRRSSSSSQFLKSHLEVSLKCLSDEEEKAFAEDAARCLRGCIWPPRSYSCSFCSREFRSAQALGGHMNVHRRDRAKLKQSPNDHDHHSRVSSSPIVEEEEEEEQKIKQAFGYSDSTAKRPLSDVISGSDDDDDHVETKLSVGLTSVLFQNRHACDNKRPKVAAVSSTLQILGLKPATSSMEGLDLELRL